MRTKSDLIGCLLQDFKYGQYYESNWYLIEIILLQVLGSFHSRNLIAQIIISFKNSLYRIFSQYSQYLRISFHSDPVFFSSKRILSQWLNFPVKVWAMNRNQMTAPSLTIVFSSKPIQLSIHSLKWYQESWFDLTEYLWNIYFFFINDLFYKLPLYNDDHVRDHLKLDANRHQLIRSLINFLDHLLLGSHNLFRVKTYYQI